VRQGAGGARGEGGAVDGGAVVGAPRVRVPQLPRESLASFVFVLYNVSHVLDAILLHALEISSPLEILVEQLARHQTIS